MQNIPKKEFNEREKTLGEVGLYPRAMLQIKELEWVINFFSIINQVVEH